MLTKDNVTIGIEWCAGLKDVRLHNLRHEAISSFFELDLSAVEEQALLVNILPQFLLE